MILDLFKKSKPKKPINFFKWRSTDSSMIKHAELLKLAVNTNPDSVNATLRNQARSLSVANSLISGYFEMIVSEILGTDGFRLDIHSATELDKKVESLFFRWRNNCCVYGVYDFSDIEEMALISLLRDGEIFIKLHNVKGEFKIELLDAAKIDNNYNDEKLNIKCGIQRAIDSLEPLYYFYRKNDYELIKIPAPQIIHIKKTLLPQQFRGISRLGAAIVDITDKDRYRERTLEQAALSASLTGFITRKSSSNISFDDEPLEIPQKAEVGKFEFLDDDLDVKFTQTQAPESIIEHLKATDREVARSLGISYHSYTGDLKEVNYSSIRHGTSMERRAFKRTQNFLKRKLHTPLFLKFLENELINKNLSPAEYKLIKSSFSFKADGWEYIDPTKEVNANKVAIESGFKTITEILRDRGIEVDTHLNDLATDAKILNKLKEIRQ